MASRKEARPRAARRPAGDLVHGDVSEQAPTGLRDLGSGYVKAFVTFIDILGFKDHVGRDEPENINAKLDVVFAVSRLRQRRAAVYARSENAPMVLQFSDSIIRVQPVSQEESANPVDQLVGEIEALCLLQGNLVCNGILVRGGLAFGDVCIRESRIFGPAFIRAYELESILARYPRILVDERLVVVSDSNPFLAQASREMRNAANEALGELLERNDDGQFSVQYLTHLFEADHPEGITNLDVLRAHRDQISGQLAKLRDAKLEEPRAKVRWAANYHNRWIASAFGNLDEKEFKSTGRGLMIEIPAIGHRNESHDNGRKDRR
jgi:class 3 adenylate cyclase